MKHLITLLGAPDYNLLIWQWDAFKILATIKLEINNSVPEGLTFDCSIHNVQNDGLKVVVTGHDVFKFMTCNYDMSGVAIQ